MKKYILNFFSYNDWANRKLLDAIQQLPEKEESVKLFSHLITTQDKWMNRITKKAEDKTLHWFDLAFPVENLAAEWTRSVNEWIGFIESLREEELENDVVFTRANDGKKIGVKIIDLALQLNYHSIHHRAQINKLISGQGMKPPATDYIYTALREV